MPVKRKQNIRDHTVTKLRLLAADIEARNERGAANNHFRIQRLHRKEVTLTTSALRGWANYLETQWADNK